MKLSPAAHTIKSLLALAADDIVTATSILTVRGLAGEASVVEDIRNGGLRRWRAQTQRWLRCLRDVTEERWARAGEVSSLLEPDLKDGRGGIRDRDVLHWAVATDLGPREVVLGRAALKLAAPAELLLSARCELHRVTGRTANVLLLQDQDGWPRRWAWPTPKY